MTPPNKRREIPIPPHSQDDADTTPDALREAVDDAVKRWDKTKDSATGMLDAERKEDI